jgi:hypothetical protein
MLSSEAAMKALQIRSSSVRVYPRPRLEGATGAAEVTEETPVAVIVEVLA